MSQHRNELGIYKQLNEEMREGLKNIYQQISSASGGAPTDALLHEASDQLGEVLKTTEQATMDIMEIVERSLDIQAECAGLIKTVCDGAATGAHLDRLRELNATLGDGLNDLFGKLAFQDLTGQRIKKVLSSLDDIGRSVVELYISSGLVMAGAEKNPATDADALRQEARKAVDDFRNDREVHSVLKGPDGSGISQDAIDDLLAQLGG